MPDQPSPRDATEAALSAECWDAVLSYADLCTAGSTAAHDLATDAFTLGVREVRAADAGALRGRRTPRLPAMPLMLTAVRATAAVWEAGGLGHRLDPDLRLWLNSPQAARYPGPPLNRPLALRALRDLQEADAALLWLTEVEALPLAVVARRLGLDPAAVSGELDQVRALFRDRCRRDHLDTPMNAECRGYARLLDAVTRPASAAAQAPEGLSRHLATCAGCAEAAACLRPHGGALPVALAGGVIGWGGLAYLERRRRAAEVRLGARRPATEAADGEPRDGAGRARVVRGSLLATAVALSALALTVSLMPFDGSASDAARGDGRRQSVADPGVLPLPAGPSPAPDPDATAAPPPSPAHSSGPPTASARPSGPAAGNPDPEPQGAASPAAGEDTPAPASSAPAGCQVRYQVVNEWSDGFQATVAVTTARPLATWRVAWSFRDGQRVGRMWDAEVAQDGSRVTATATDYNSPVAAGATFAFGFVADRHGTNSAPQGFSLNGRACAVT